MKKLLTIIGARPQIIKAAALNRAIRNNNADRLQEVLVHTGQHYDHGMSEVFFQEMGIPQPHYNLGIGSGNHGVQTGKMLEAIEAIVIKEKPNGLVVYGDTNSTLAGALAGAKLHVPVIHIEAGLRSFNKRMPEEVNRITADHASTFLFTPTLAGSVNLSKEGFRTLEEAKLRGAADINNPYVFHCGDLMYDNTLYYGAQADERSELFSTHGIDTDNFVLCTIHRPQNTDDIEVLIGILSALHEISLEHDLQIVLPLHPRTAKMIAGVSDPRLAALRTDPNFKIIDPVGFLEMILLEKHARLIMTDSGGVQKEAFFMKKPCVILRPETEWTEIVEHGWGILAGSDPKKIKDGFLHFSKAKNLDHPSIFGDGNAAEFICRSIIEYLD